MEVILCLQVDGPFNNWGGRHIKGRMYKRQVTLSCQRLCVIFSLNDIQLPTNLPSKLSTITLIVHFKIGFSNQFSNINYEMIILEVSLS